jgi:hypothetical protein
MKIAVCFRGISRSLSHTIDSIRENVIAPSRAFGEVRVFTHLFDQKTINNPRSGEIGQLDYCKVTGFHWSRPANAWKKTITTH